ncbi:MAG: hypothetical protein ACI9A2_002890, partial [Halioglobus sp.]
MIPRCSPHMPGSVYENIADRITGEGIWVYGL